MGLDVGPSVGLCVGRLEGRSFTSSKENIRNVGNPLFATIDEMLYVVTPSNALYVS